MNLKNMREQAGLKQAELAAISGVNLRSLQDYEQGHKLISSAKGETLLKLSRALGYSIEDILIGSTVEIEHSAVEQGDIDKRVLEYNRVLQKRKMTGIHFPIIEKDEIVDMSRIYPTKQVFVKKVLKQLRFDERIKSLRLFGSGITMACNKDSDIDFAIDLYKNTLESKNDISEKIQLACDWSADIIWMDHLTCEDRVYKDIMKGLVLI